MDVKPSWVFTLGFKTQYYKRVFLLLGSSLGICRVLGFCPGVTGFNILVGWRGLRTKQSDPVLFLARFLCSKWWGVNQFGSGDLFVCVRESKCYLGETMCVKLLINLHLFTASTLHMHIRILH